MEGTKGNQRPFFFEMFKLYATLTNKALHLYSLC